MNSKPETNVDRPAKKAYEMPQLVAYGSVAEMTQSGATVSANDGSTHRARRP